MLHGGVLVQLLEPNKDLVTEVAGVDIVGSWSGAVQEDGVGDVRRVGTLHVLHSQVGVDILYQLRASSPINERIRH